MDDPFVSCPYNRHHRVPRSRIQAHLARCEQRYPPLAICPYNATHRMAADVIMAHVHECDSRLAMLPDHCSPRAQAALSTPKPTLQKDYMAKDDPDNDLWDD